jgi:3-dehydroquinate dehydratase-1
LVKEKKICASIPILDVEIHSLVNKIEYALKEGVDFIEFRFDYLEDFENLNVILENISKYSKQSIYTLRPVSEGGKFAENDSKRVSLLKILALARPMLLDLEYVLVSTNNEMADFIDKNEIRTLVSWHDFEGTPDEDTLVDMVDKMRIFSQFIKIVTTANTIEDTISTLKIYSLIDTSISLIAFSMGELGIISRVLCNIVGDAPFTYATVDNAVAPGQLTIKQMNSIYLLFHDKLI